MALFEVGQPSAI